MTKIGSNFVNVLSSRPLDNIDKGHHAYLQTLMFYLYQHDRTLTRTVFGKLDSNENEGKLLEYKDKANILIRLLVRGSMDCTDVFAWSERTESL
jgi:hypothetical protein